VTTSRAANAGLESREGAVRGRGSIQASALKVCLPRLCFSLVLVCMTIRRLQITHSADIASGSNRRPPGPDRKSDEETVHHCRSLVVIKSAALARQLGVSRSERAWHEDPHCGAARLPARAL
jgi:hypothetical protein